jgi:hypothetical protein
MTRRLLLWFPLVGVFLAASNASAGRTAVVLPPDDSAAGCFVQSLSLRLADDGRVAGTTSCAGRNRATVWTGGPWVDLGSLGGDNSQAIPHSGGGER